jgi:hypothetical protein
MDETIFAELMRLATMTGMEWLAEMISDNIAFVPLAVFAIYLVCLTAKNAKGSGGFFRALFAGGWCNEDEAVDRMFEQRNLPALKSCPGCAEQLPLSTLICESCDYNFLTGMAGGAQRMLPAPEAQVFEIRPRNFAYRA